MIKIRINAERSLYDFESMQLAFDWVKEELGEQHAVISVLSYSGLDYRSLESMDRYHYNGRGFKREDIQS